MDAESVSKNDGDLQRKLKLLTVLCGYSFPPAINPFPFLEKQKLLSNRSQALCHPIPH
jgi:hypothetical protein